MKAAYIEQPGPPESLTYGDLPDPSPRPTEVLIRVGATSINPIDTYIRGGLIQMNIPLPYIVGCDLAGTIEALGGEVTGFEKGQRVWGTNQGLLGRQGTFSELASVDPAWLYATPDGVSDADAAACSLVGITAHLGLVEHANLKSGETLFINGGSGGVGSMVIQMAKILGARVIATAGSPAKCQRCQELGADVALNYHTINLGEALQEHAPDGVDVWWETTREPNFDQVVSALAQRGRMVLMAGRDARPEFPVGPFYLKSASLHGFVMFLASPESQRRCAQDINQWLQSGKLRANIDRQFPLEAAAQAHQLQEDNTLRQSGTLSGKIVVLP